MSFDNYDPTISTYFSIFQSLFSNSSAASGGAIGCLNFGFDLNRKKGLSNI